MQVFFFFFFYIWVNSLKNRPRGWFALYCPFPNAPETMHGTMGSSMKTSDNVTAVTFFFISLQSLFKTEQSLSAAWTDTETIKAPVSGTSMHFIASLQQRGDTWHVPPGVTFPLDLIGARAGEYPWLLQSFDLEMSANCHWTKKTDVSRCWLFFGCDFDGKWTSVI